MAKRTVAIGVDLGGTSLRAAAVDSRGKILGRAETATRPQEGEEAVRQRLVEVISGARKEAGLAKKDLVGVGVGVPGAVDARTGLVHFAPNLGWSKVELGPYLKKQLGATIVLDNDVNVAVLGEQRFGAAKKRQDVVGVWVGTGVGGGIIVNGSIVRGYHGSAGELGHTVLLPDGPPCGCGSRGCVEALASRTAMEREIRRRISRGESSLIPKILRKSGKERVTSGVLAKALKQGDPVVADVMAQAQRYLGLAIASWLNVLDSEAVILGGGVAEKFGESFLAPIREAAERYRFPSGGEPPAYVVAELGDDSGIYGAASLVL